MPSSADIFKKSVKDRLGGRGGQAKLAEKLGVKPVQVSKVLAEGVDTVLSTVDRYAQALGCEPWELLRPAESLGKVFDEKGATDDRAAKQAPGGEASKPEDHLGVVTRDKRRCSGATDDHHCDQRDVHKEGLHAPTSADMAAILSRLDRIEAHQDPLAGLSPIKRALLDRLSSLDDSQVPRYLTMMDAEIAAAAGVDQPLKSNKKPNKA